MMTAVDDAGTDVDCGDFVPANAQSALDKSLITEADLDGARSACQTMRTVVHLASHAAPMQPVHSRA